MISKDIMKKKTRKKIIWDEIKAKEQEYKHLQRQIDELEEKKSDISFLIQSRLKENENISEYLYKFEK